MRITFDPNMPAPFIGPISEMLAKVRPMIPPNVESVYFKWVPKEDSGMQSCHDSDYRLITIRITGESFDNEPGSFARYLVHECGHYYNAPLDDTCRTIVKDVFGTDDCAGYRLANSFLDTKIEQTNTDLTNTFLRLLGLA